MFLNMTNITGRLSEFVDKQFLLQKIGKGGKNEEDDNDQLFLPSSGQVGVALQYGLPAPFLPQQSGQNFVPVRNSKDYVQCFGSA